MKVVVGTEPQLVEADDLTSLSVERRGGADVDAVLRAAGAGTVADEHAWLSIAWLRARGPAGDAEWPAGFAKMIHYAASKGWADAEHKTVRAHIV
ncbi:hypothetical protein [Amycolatopsis sp. NPDC051903]|uniref:hypothetical protein n=1 Tax=Amycolatopsis sp. NPDC051903 TaxID=3363936 RepID=UPI0037B1855C